MASISQIRELLDYDPITGIFRWKVGNGRKRIVGAVAGQALPAGYLTVKIDGRTEYLHRLAWAFVYGRRPKNNIDHINGISNDNRIVNLRDISQRMNSQNSHKARSECGLMGVAKFRMGFRAEIRIQGRKTHIGVFPTATEAHAAYIAAKVKHHPGYVVRS